MNEHTPDCWVHSWGGQRGPRRGRAAGESVWPVREKSSFFPWRWVLEKHCGTLSVCFLNSGPAVFVSEQQRNCDFFCHLPVASSLCQSCEFHDRVASKWLKLATLDNFRNKLCSSIPIKPKDREKICKFSLLRILTQQIVETFAW